MKRFLVITSFALLWASCSIKAPEVRVTGEKTALEREVIGTYQQLQEDTWMIASKRSASSETVTVAPEKQRVLDALQQQKFNKDDVDEFKKKGFVGENNQGLLEIRESADLESNPETKTLVEQIVNEENASREVIMNRVVEINESLKQSVRQSVLAIFAQMNQDNSPVGTWIQRQLGDWVKK
jgi:uncharacterized protein YdbL (DUF1318 family)